MLKKIFVVIVLLLTVPAGALAGGLVNQQLFVRLDPETHSLAGQATLSLAAAQDGWPVGYRLAPNAEIDSIEADGRPLPFSFKQGILHVSPGSNATSLTLTYRVRFDDPVPQATIGIEDPSYGVTATIMPQGVFLSSVAAWHPVPVDRDSRFRVTIAGPPGLTGVTAGRLVEQTSTSAETRTTWQTALPQTDLALAAGYYQLHRANLGEIQILAFMSPGNDALAGGYLESCREYLQLYQNLFGPYPYAKFAVVENFYPTGYGLPGWTLLGSSVIRLPFIRTTSLPHEIAHAWWGNAVEVDYATGNWAEGLATYVADYYLNELNASAEALEYRRKILRDYAVLVAAEDDLPLRAFHGRMTRRDQAVGYGKAAMVFQMLRDLLGDQAFWSGLQAAAREGRGKRYGWSDLQRHFEAASAMDLSTFFRQWIERPGAPQLLLADVRLKPVADGWQVSGKIRQTVPFFALTVPLRLATPAGSVIQTIKLSGEQAGFSFHSTTRPLSLTVDPDSRLFRKLYPEELPATVNNLRASRMPQVIVAAGAEPLLEASRDLLRGLQWQQAPVLSEADYLARPTKDRDLLILGWPHSPELRPQTQAGVRLTGQQLLIGDKLYEKTEDVLFMVVDGPEADHVAGYFLPGSIAAARDTARRIPHYGRYSYLVFSNGRNQVKATWAPTRSPLQRVFEKDDAQ